ncbi:epigen-like isoform X1 [Chiloscyllium punctatum]|uniref:epigen-like isoform X1 n=1 Tax=Chiloscyllium punctatum TaxID=137246 RepID=UPI003B63FF3E
MLLSESEVRMRMESVTGQSFITLSVIFAAAVAPSELTEVPFTESLHTPGVSENTSATLEPITGEHRGNPETPKTLRVRQQCYEGGQSYCMNGDCRYHEDQDQITNYRICVCKPGYMGERCEHLTLTTHTSLESERYLYISIAIGIGLVFSGLTVLLYYCCRNRCQKSKSMYNKCCEEARV